MTRSQRWSFVGLAFLALVVVAAMILLPTPGVATVRNSVRGTGVLAWGAFLLLMVGATQLPVPRTVWTVSAGVLFGPVVGSLLALTGMAVSVTLSLVLLRWIGGPAARRYDGPNAARASGLSRRRWRTADGSRSSACG